MPAGSEPDRQRGACACATAARVVRRDEALTQSARAPEHRLDRLHRRRGERVRSRRPQRRDPAAIRRRAGSSSTRVAAKPADRRVLPRHHDLRRRHAEHRQRDVARRSVRLERDERANRAGERLGRRAEQPLRANPELAHAALDELALRRARAQTIDTRDASCVSRLSSSSPSSPCHSPPPDAIGEHDHAGAPAAVDDVGRP